MPVIVPDGLYTGRCTQIVLISGAVVTLQVTDAQVSFPSWRDIYLDLTGCTQFGLYEGHGAGTNADTRYGIQYTRDLTGATGWTWLDGSDGAEEPAVSLAIPALATNYQGGPFAIDPLACTLVRLRARFFGGNSQNHNFGSVGGWAR